MAPKKAAKKVTHRAALKKATKRTNVLQFTRCDEITNRGGILYRCVEQAGHKGGCRFGIRLDTPPDWVPPRRGKTKLTEEELFIRAIGEYYSSDTLAPGLVTSYVRVRPASTGRVEQPEQWAWYASVARYTNSGQKIVVCVAKSLTSLADAKSRVIAMWRQVVSRPAKPALRQFMGVALSDWDQGQGSW